MKCGIALGSNIGDRMQNLQTARDELAMKYGELRRSQIYETEPVDCEPGTMPYLNAVVEFNYEGRPTPLLDELRAIENKMGRPSRRPRHAPRTIDLDILYIGDLVCSNGRIVIPHPRLHARRFVLAPLCDICPALILPGFRENIAELLKKLPSKPAAEIFSEKF